MMQIELNSKNTTGVMTLVRVCLVKVRAYLTEKMRSLLTEIFLMGLDAKIWKIQGGGETTEVAARPEQICEGG